MVDFNLQTFLSEMREELCGKIDRVDGKVDMVTVRITDHETRISVVENTRKIIRWLAGVLLVGAVAFVFDVIYSHLFGGPHVP